MEHASSLPPPEQVSARLLARVGGSDIPTDLRRIVGFWPDLDLVEEDLDAPGYLLPLGKLGAEIIVRKADPPERKRFTTAHELGHWVLGLTWQKKFGEFRQPPALRHEAIEKWCDSFATSLLMPKLAIQRHFERHFHSELISHVLGAPSDFQVSREAMFIRLWEVLQVLVVQVDLGESRRGGRTEARFNKAFGDKEANAEAEEILRAPQVIEALKGPLIFFQGRLSPRWNRCSGRVEALKGRKDVILAFWDSTARPG
jgi:Zn-dependent peptidase ImmA (M78 family)